MTSGAAFLDRRKPIDACPDHDELYQLRRIREQLVQIMDSLPGLVGYVDLDLTIVYANRLIEDWYQMSQA